MSFLGIIGSIVEIKRNSEELSFEWHIKFPLVYNNRSSWYESSYFGFSDVCWLLKLYRDGKNLGIYLFRKNLGAPKIVTYAFGIKGRDGVEKKVVAEREFSKIYGGYGFPQFCLISELSKHESRLMPNNILTISCDLKTGAAKRFAPLQDVSIQTDEECSEKNTSTNGNQLLGVDEWQKSLLKLLESRKESDVVIKVKGEEFPAHRLILLARSPVFEAMFSHDMVEKHSGIVTMEDCDPDSFPDFLKYIYSGSTEIISVKNVFSLYTASDKYDLNTLKEECSVFMKKNLTVASFCDTLALAVKFDEKELIQLATEFFCTNTLEIVKTVEWQTFLAGNPTVGNELFILSYSQKK